MKFFVGLIAVLVAVVLIVLLIGFALPRDHVATIQTQYRAPADRVFEVIADVERGVEWRSGLEKVDVLAREPLRWRETGEWGTMTFVRDELIVARRMVARIADEDQGFGGTWTYEIAPSPNGTGTMLVIRENGWVSNPLFRFVSKYVFSHYSGLEAYARDLGRRLGESAEPVRVD